VVWKILPLFSNCHLSSTGFFKSKVAVLKSSKHGFISLCIPGHDPPVDITIFMDIHTNPGPTNGTDHLSTLYQRFSVNDSTSTSTDHSHRIVYTRSELFTLRKYSSMDVSNNVCFSTIKSLGIFRYRSKRGGKCKLHNESKHDPPTDLPITCQLPDSKFLHFCLLNARSVNNKPLQIKDYLVENDIDIFGITETWIKANENSDFISREISPTGYLFSQVPRIDRSGGGIGILFKKSLKAEHLQLNKFKSFEHMETLFYLSSSLIRTVIVYRPPISTANGLTYNQFYSDFSTLLERLVSSSGKLIIAGDFNFHVEDSSDTHAKRFLDLLYCFNLSVHDVMTPTHKNKHVLDIIITRSDELSLVKDVNVHDPVISDHYAVHCNLSVHKSKLPTKIISFRKLKKIDKDQFHDDITISSLLQSPASDLTELCNQYESVLSTILNNHAPIRSKSITVRPKAPWYTNDINENKIKRRRLERCWRRSGLTVDRQMYVDQCNVVKDMIFKAKMNYYSKLISDADTDNNALFKSIDRLLHRSPDRCLPTCDSLFTLSNDFVYFFKKKISNIRDRLPATAFVINDLFLKFDQPTLDCQLDELSPTACDELHKLAKKLASKSCSLDPLPSNLLVTEFVTLLPIICKIVNLSLKYGYVPPVLKMAVLKPLLKKSSLDHNVLGNYRPISNLKSVSKIIEKIVADRLNNYLTTNNLHEPFQSAYKHRHSCETALVRVQNDILQSIDKRKCVVLLLLDLSAAFDTVDHDILLNRLHTKFGICGNALNWFKSYLSNRSQFVSLDDANSDTLDLNCGVPQGSVLGPILYLLYTSPVSNILHHHNMSYHLYADDTQLYIPFSNNDDADITQTATRIENCLSDIAEWMTINKLKLNTDKTELLFLHSKTTTLSSTPTIQFANDVLKPSAKARNIGVIFDSTMSMVPHINNVCKTAFYHLRNIAKIRKYLSFKTTEILIHAFVTSKIDNYNSLLFGLPKCLISKIQSVQNAAARIITLSCKSDHITPILIDLHWLPVSERIKFKILLITFKAIHHMAPSYISDMISLYKPPRLLRSSSGILLNHHNYNTKTYGHRSFSTCAPELWNSLPSSLRNVTDLASFKSSLKTLLFKQAFNL
jgi:exonuclease III